MTLEGRVPLIAQHGFSIATGHQSCCRFPDVKNPRHLTRYPPRFRPARLRSLSLATAGPDLPDGNQGDCKVMVRLPEFEDLNAQLGDHKTVGYTTSHALFPGSTKVEVGVDYSVDLTQVLTQVFHTPTRKRPIRRTHFVTINTDITLYSSTADDFCWIMTTHQSTARKLYSGLRPRS